MYKTNCTSILILKAASLHKSSQVGDLRDLKVAHVVARSRSSRVGHIIAVFSKEDTEMKIAGGLQLWKWVIYDYNEDEDPTKTKIATEMKIAPKRRIVVMELKKLPLQRRCGFQRR